MIDETDNTPVEQEIERIFDLLIPYLCEHTGLAKRQIVSVMNAQETFWNNQSHVIGRMFILGIELDEDDGEGDDA